MTRIMVIVGSVRPGRIGLPIAEWVRDQLSVRPGVEVDFVDLAELALPFMDEPNHPRLRRYTHQHTIEWSGRVQAADAVVFVAPEYNHSFAPALKNAIDFLAVEWRRMPAAFVSYGGLSGGGRGVVALQPALAVLGLLLTTANVEIPFAAKLVDDGRFAATDHVERSLAATLDELELLVDAGRALRD